MFCELPPGFSTRVKRKSAGVVIDCIRLIIFSPENTKVFHCQERRASTSFKDYMPVMSFFAGEFMQQLIETESKLKEKTLIVTVDSVRASRPQRWQLANTPSYVSKAVITMQND